MTIKDLVSKLNYKQVFNEIYSYYLKKEKTPKVMELDNAFYLAWKDLAKLKPEESDHEDVRRCQISLVKAAEEATEVGGASGDYIDVCLYDKEDDAFFAADFQPWGCLIEKEIITTINLTKEQIMAHILWEITFWGFSSEKVKEAGGNLLNDQIS